MNTRNSFPDSIQIIRSKRRTLSLQVRHNGQVIVRAPYSTSLAEIEAFIRKNAGWLKKHMDMVEREQEKEAASPCTVWQDHHPKSENPVGKLLLKRKPQFQLPAHAGTAGSPGLCDRTRALPQKRNEPLSPLLVGGRQSDPRL